MFHLWQQSLRTGVESFLDRKITRLNSSHEWISYAVFCLKKKRVTGVMLIDLSASKGWSTGTSTQSAPLVLAESPGCDDRRTGWTVVSMEGAARTIADSIM